MKAFTSTSLRVNSEGLWILDQTQLPQREVWLESKNPGDMIQIIKELKVRGAPLIGVAASLQLARLVEQGTTEAEFTRSLQDLREARPTAVNLMNCLDRLKAAFSARGLAAVVDEAEAICNEDVSLCERMASYGAGLIHEGDSILTHCNTGGLATVGVGTALGAVIQAWQQRKKIHVYVDETRPLLQGGRLTTWELERSGIPYTLICDNMAAFLMQKEKVSKVMVGSDRIAMNGDFANKVGTYSLAVNAKFHGVPFYVVAPQTTVDEKCKHGGEIPVEERSSHEVRGVRGAFGEVEWSAPGATVWNPAFDVTPESLVTAWVLDRGVLTREDVARGALRP